MLNENRRLNFFFIDPSTEAKNICVCVQNVQILMQKNQHGGPIKKVPLSIVLVHT